MDNYKYDVCSKRPLDKYSGLDNGESLRGQKYYFKHDHGNVSIWF